jgi:hypothetical protein
LPKELKQNQKETVKSGTRESTAKMFSSSDDLLVSFVGFIRRVIFSPTSRAGTVLLDVGPIPHPVAWPDS